MGNTLDVSTLSCSTQLSVKLIMLINIKMPTLVEYLNINRHDKWVEHEQGSYRQV